MQILPPETGFDALQAALLQALPIFVGYILAISLDSINVRTFDKAETDKEGDSLNKIRRDARSARRRLRRRAHRLLRLARLFKGQGLIGNCSPVAFALPVSTWQLRSGGLDRQLNPREWCSVMYRIVKHRGFQSTRKSEASSKQVARMQRSGIREDRNRVCPGFRKLHPGYSLSS